MNSKCRQRKKCPSSSIFIKMGKWKENGVSGCILFHPIIKSNGILVNKLLIRRLLNKELEREMSKEKSTRFCVIIRSQAVSTKSCLTNHVGFDNSIKTFSSMYNAYGRSSTHKRFVATSTWLKLYFHFASFYAIWEQLCHCIANWQRIGKPHDKIHFN